MPHSQARDNYEAYEAKYRAALEREHLGRFALMHNREVVNIYNDEGDAYSIGCEKFGVGKFSLQEIGAKPVHLGIMTAALN